MSCTETETLVSSSDAKEIEADIRQRKTARIDESLTTLSKNELRPRRVCRRHSYAFRCADNEIDNEHGDEGKHSESVLLVKLDLLLARMEARMKSLEAMGVHGVLDETIAGVYQTVANIKEKCGGIGMIDEGWRKAEIVLSELHDRYNETPGISFPSKLVSSMKLLEQHLVDLETYAYDRLTNIHPIDYVDSSLHAGADLAKQSLDQLANAIKDGTLRLLTIDEIPSDWHNNPHILRGYRFYENKMQCVYSICRIHNETGNIWTHILGFFFVLAIGIYWYPRSASYEIATTADKLVCAVFLFAALECLACSTIWHTFSNFANLRAMKKIACVDYVGISVLIAASILTVEYHGFYCQPAAQISYMTSTTVLGIVGMFIPWLEWFDRHENLHFKVAFFVGLATSGVIPVLHLMVIRGIPNTILFYAPIIKSLLGYIVGVVVYANRWPEKWWPGMFDTWFSSHQLWHVAILVGIYYHYKSMEGFLAMAKEFACSDIMG